jgi:putative oxidoreductase
MPLAPLAGMTDVVLLLVRVVLGVVTVYYGWPKLRDPAKNARDFESTGFRPGWLWGGIVLATEFGGGLAVLVGILTWLAAAAIGFEMLVGFVVKATKWRKPFTDYSYDLQLAALALVLLTFGPGRLSLDFALFLT